MNHYHISFVDNDGTFYSASVETPQDLFTTAGIDDMALELGERLDQEEPVAIINIILETSVDRSSICLMQ